MVANPAQSEVFGNVYCCQSEKENTRLPLVTVTEKFCVVSVLVLCRVSVRRVCKPRYVSQVGLIVTDFMTEAYECGHWSVCVEGGRRACRSPSPPPPPFSLWH